MRNGLVTAANPSTRSRTTFELARTAAYRRLLAKQSQTLSKLSAAAALGDVELVLGHAEVLRELHVQICREEAA